VAGLLIDQRVGWDLLLVDVEIGIVQQRAGRGAPGSGQQVGNVDLGTFGPQLLQAPLQVVAWVAPGPGVEMRIDEGEGQAAARGEQGLELRDQRQHLLGSSAGEHRVRRDEVEPLAGVGNVEIGNAARVVVKAVAIVEQPVGLRVVGAPLRDGFLDDVNAPVAILVDGRAGIAQQATVAVTSQNPEAGADCESRP
jgi:hypothetical protein